MFETEPLMTYPAILDVPEAEFSEVVQGAAVVSGHAITGQRAGLFTCACGLRAEGVNLVAHHAAVGLDKLLADGHVDADTRAVLPSVAAAEPPVFEWRRVLELAQAVARPAER